VAEETIANSQAQWVWRILSSTVITDSTNEISSSGVVAKPNRGSVSFMGRRSG
jgi:hypothetical protein